MISIRNLLSKKKPYNFIYPYSADIFKKRIELKQNLEQGILFEDLGLFIEWNTQYSNLQRFVHLKHKNKEYKDYGRHFLIDGLEVGLNPHETVTNSTKFIQLESFLGFDIEGHTRYLAVKHHIIERFGEPTGSSNDLPYDFFGDTSLSWTCRGFEIRLSVWERFAVHYFLNVEHI